MKEKNKIVIPTGAEPEETPETPHFDAEETLLSARPVVPLTREAVEAAQSPRSVVSATPGMGRIPMLALIIIAAVTVGLAGGLAIGLYQGRQRTPTPVAAQPSSTTTTVDTHFKQKPAEETSKTQPLPSVQTVADTDKPTEPAALSQPEGDPTAEEMPETQANPESSDTPKPKPQAMPEKKMPDEKQSPPPAVSRKKPQGLRAGDDGEKKREKTARRRQIGEQNRDEDIPRTVERANQELNRIREIFEGPRP